MWRTLPQRISLLTMIGVFLSLLVNPAAHGLAAEQRSTSKIERLIEDLGSDDYETREAASGTLMELEEAIPLLQKARKSANLEVRSRTGVILQTLAKKRARQGLARAKLLAKTGHIIEATDRVAYWGELDGAGEGWQILTQFAARVVESTARYFPPRGFWYTPKCPYGDFARYSNDVHTREITGRKIFICDGKEKWILNKKAPDANKVIVKVPGPFIVRGDEISFSNNTYVSEFGICWGIIAASGNVQVPSAPYSLIIAGGNVKINGLRCSIIVCDGDVEFSSFTPGPCLIIARGKVTCAAGKIKGCLVRSGRTLQLPDDRKIDLKGGAIDPLAFVKFFELADVGLAAEDLAPRAKADIGGVRLKEVSKTSPFAPGLRAGDVITTIDNKKTPSTDVFRRVLRQKLAESGPFISFTVKRDSTTLEIPIPVKD